MSQQKSQVKSLFKVLSRYGLPDHFINMVTRLHADAVVNFKLGNEEVEVKNRIGVRQGACEGPVLFIFIMAAAMETMEWPVAKPTFRTSTAYHHLHGERSDRKQHATSFEFFASLFADDCAVLFESHSDMVIGMGLYVQISPKVWLRDRSWSRDSEEQD